MNHLAPSTTRPALDPALAANLRRARRDPLLILAARVWLVSAASFDEAWDELETLKPGFYTPDAAWEAFMRTHWKELAARAPKGEMRWRDRFLSALRAGRSVKFAAKEARVSMQSVHRERARDEVFAAAWDEAEKRT